MLKITPNQIDGGATRLTLEGRPVGPWVGELHRVSHGVLDQCGELVLDHLLALLRQGDEHAYEQLVRRYGGRLLAVTRRLLRGDEEEARDAVQDAFLSAFRSIDRFNQDAALGTWLHRIAVNAALMKRRRAGSRPEVALDPLLPTFDETAHHTEVVHSWPVSAETIVMRAQTRSAVRQCIDRLPDTYRTILLMRDIEELSTSETAEALGITENAVKIRLHRARQALRTLLDPTMSVG